MFDEKDKEEIRALFMLFVKTTKQHLNAVRDNRLTDSSFEQMAELRNSVRDIMLIYENNERNRKQV